MKKKNEDITIKVKEIKKMTMSLAAMHIARQIDRYILEQLKNSNPQVEVRRKK